MHAREVASAAHRGASRTSGRRATLQWTADVRPTRQDVASRESAQAGWRGWQAGRAARSPVSERSASGEAENRAGGFVDERDALFHHDSHTRAIRTSHPPGSALGTPQQGANLCWKALWVGEVRRGLT
jgi:hypothetical protein